MKRLRTKRKAPEMLTEVPSSDAGTLIAMADTSKPIKPSPQKVRESSREFRHLVQGTGSAKAYVAAVKKESKSYVSQVRTGRYRDGTTAA